MNQSKIIYCPREKLLSDSWINWKLHSEEKKSFKLKETQFWLRFPALSQRENNETTSSCRSYLEVKFFFLTTWQIIGQRKLFEKRFFQLQSYFFCSTDSWNVLPTFQKFVKKIPKFPNKKLKKYNFFLLCRETQICWKKEYSQRPETM